MPALIRFSTREWCGMLGVALWGVMLGAIPFHGATTGMFLAVLVGPPIAFLILPKRPFLSWQIWSLAGAFSAAFSDHNPQDPSNPVLAAALMGWIAFSLFSLPWPFILARRSQRAREEGDSSASLTVKYMGASLLVFLSCGLIIIGVAGCYFGIANSSAPDRATPFIGCVTASVGICLAVFLCRRTGELRINKSVEDLFGLLLSFVGFFLIGMAVGETFFATPCPPGESCAPVRRTDLFWMWVVSTEVVATLVWLIRRGRRRRVHSRT
jgi:hypothetical protein